MGHSAPHSAFFDLVRVSSPRHEVALDSAGVWILASPRTSRLPGQGWKLHVAAGPRPRDVLRRCLGVLSQEAVHFKVLASSSLLLDLSAGAGGLSQIGKFITVYPASDRDAVRLASALDAATSGCEGPSIPSDRPLRPGSLVHYRFGCFTDRRVTTLLGQAEPAIRGPDGRWIPARARPFYEQPPWVQDPFAPDASESTKTPPSGPTIAGRFVPVRVLARGARGCTWLALDTRKLRRCVVKEALPWVVLGRDGSDARRRLVHEASMLEAVAPLAIAPRPYGLFDHEGAAYLAMEDIAGATLDGEVMSRIVRRGLPGGATIARLGARLASGLAQLHRQGLVHRDLKPSNVIRRSRHYRFLDFELCLPEGAAPAWGAGTEGYMSPQQRAGCPARPSDDVYSLGALLLFAATGSDPSVAPDPNRLRAGRIADLNPRLPGGVIAIIERCLERQPHRRPRDADGVAASFNEWLDAGGVRAARAVRRPHAPVGARPHRNLDGVTRRLSRILEAELQEWLERERDGAPLHLNDGAAGGVLVLSELVHRSQDGGLRRLLRQAGERLVTAAHTQAATRLPGLCVGDAGVAAAVLRAGVVLTDGALIAWGRRRAHWALRQPSHSPDVFHGLAGRVWLGLQLLERWPSCALERTVTSAADELVAAGRHGLWAIPEGYSGLSGQAYFGFAHGTAGIGHVLIALFERTGDAKYRKPISDCARRLRAQGVATLGGRGTTWPISDRDPMLPGPFWCHGAAGVGSFFLDLWRASLDRRALAVAQSAACTVVQTGRWLGPTQCHGLSGSVEFLLDMYQATHDRKWREGAEQVGTLLAEHATTAPAGRLARTGLGWFTGFPGTIAALLRLREPETGRRILWTGFLPPPMDSA